MWYKIIVVSNTKSWFSEEIYAYKMQTERIPYFIYDGIKFLWKKYEM